MTDFQAKQIRELRLGALDINPLLPLSDCPEILSEIIVRAMGWTDMPLPLFERKGTDGKRDSVSLLRQRIDPAFHRKEAERFCSDKCRAGMVVSPSGANKRKSAYYEATCVYCGKTFARMEIRTAGTAHECW